MLQYVSCPLHKRNFTLTGGECLNDADYTILSFDAREGPENHEDIQLLLPPEKDLDAVIGTEKWLIRQAVSEALGLNSATQIDVVGPSGELRMWRWQARMVIKIVTTTYCNKNL